MYTPFADQENPSKQLKCYHAMKECESATVSAEHDLSQENNDTGNNTIAYDENNGVFDDSQADADELNMTSSSDDLVTSAARRIYSMKYKRKMKHQQVSERQKNHSMKAAKYQKCTLVEIDICKCYFNPFHPKGFPIDE